MSQIRKLVALLACALLTTLSLTLVPAPSSAQDTGRLFIEVSASNRDLPTLRLVAWPWDPVMQRFDWYNEEQVVINPSAANPRRATVDTMFHTGTWAVWLEDPVTAASSEGGLESGTGFPEHWGDGVTRRPGDQKQPGAPGTFTLAAEGEHSVSFTYGDMHSLSGTVTTDGFPTPGALVGAWVYFGADPQYTLATRTDAEGRYEFTSLPEQSVMPSWVRGGAGTPETAYFRDGSRWADYDWPEEWPSVLNNVLMSTDEVVDFEFNGLNPAPVALVAPSIPATGRVGETLTLDRGRWSNTPRLTMQWMRNGVPIPGATAQTYTPVHGDVGTNLTVVVTATHPFHHPGTATTNTAAMAPLPAPEPPAVTKVAARIKVAKVAKKRKVRITVTAPGVRPTGSVVVKVKKVRLGVVKLVKGKATLKVKAKTLRKVLKGKLRGKVKLTVAYSGDDFVHSRTVRQRVKFA